MHGAKNLSVEDLPKACSPRFEACDGMGYRGQWSESRRSASWIPAFCSKSGGAWFDEDPRL
jgi:hypothetical protein